MKKTGPILFCAGFLFCIPLGFGQDSTTTEILTKLLADRELRHNKEVKQLEEKLESFKDMIADYEEELEERHLELIRMRKESHRPSGKFGRRSEDDGMMTVDELIFKNGNKIQAKIKSYKDGYIELEMPNGEKKRGPLSTLAEIRFEAVKVKKPQTDVASRTTTGVTPEPAATDERPKTEEQLALSPYWKNKIVTSDSSVRDLRSLLLDFGKANVDLNGDSTLKLWGEITYLMPLDKALKTLNKFMTPPKQVQVGGFPFGSFQFYKYSGNFGERFNELLLITDIKRQVIGVQMVETGPKSRWLYTSQSSSSPTGSFYQPKSRSYYNLIENKRKGKSSWNVINQVTKKDKLVVIDSELIDVGGYYYYGYLYSTRYKSKECNRLIIPQQIADLILFTVNLY